MSVMNLSAGAIQDFFQQFKRDRGRGQFRAICRGIPEDLPRGLYETVHRITLAANHVLAKPIDGMSSEPGPDVHECTRKINRRIKLLARFDRAGGKGRELRNLFPAVAEQFYRKSRTNEDAGDSLRVCGQDQALDEARSVQSFCSNVELRSL